MDFIVKLVPDMPTILGMIAAFIVPLLVYKVNEKIHQKIDPPWKQEERQKIKNQQS